MDDRSMIFSKSGLTQSSPGLTQLALTGTQSQLPHTQRVTEKFMGLGVPCSPLVQPMYGHACP